MYLLHIFFILYSIIRMANTKLNVTEYVTISVSIVDNAVVILFKSDGVEKKKTMPLTEKGLEKKEWLKELFAMPEFEPASIWWEINPEKWPGRLADCVIDLAKEAKAKQAKVDDKFASLGLDSSNPIDAL